MYGAMEVDATPMLKYIEQARARGQRITATHLVGRAVALAIAEVPELNVRLIGLNTKPKDSVDVFFLTAVRGGKDLSGVCVRSADQRTALDIASELDARASQVRRGRDRDFSRSKRLLNGASKPLARLVLRAATAMTQRYNVSFPALGIRANAFGSAMVSSVGMFGIPMGFAPLAWTYSVPMLVLVGEITDKPVVVDQRITVRPMLWLTATFDHRYADGAHVGKVVEVVRRYLAHPEHYEPAALGTRTLRLPAPREPSYSSPPPAA